MPNVWRDLRTRFTLRYLLIKRNKKIRKEHDTQNPDFIHCFYTFSRHTRLGIKNLDFVPNSANYSQMGEMLVIAKMENKLFS